MPSVTSAAVGWSVVFLVAGGFYFVSNQRKNKNRRALPGKGASKPKESRRELKSKKTRKDLESSRNKQEARLSIRARKASTEHKASQPTSLPSHAKEEYNERVNKKSVSAKVGLSARAESRVSHKSKSAKQGLAHEKQRSESPDNATGNEADDESAHNSPKPNAKTLPSIPASQDISDMLEKPLVQPSVLKVTAPKSVQPNLTGNRKSLKKEEHLETKKQRQNRKKAAEAKLARAQEEQDRKAKLEKQRRIVRESEGRAAKDGSLFMASQIPQSSAWTAHPRPEYNIIPTYQSIYSESEDHGSANQELSALSEEEQVRNAMKETETWNVVKGKEKRNRAAKSTGVKFFKPEMEFHVPKPLNSSNPAPLVPDRLPNYFVQHERKCAEEINSLEDSEWEVS